MDFLRVVVGVVGEDGRSDGWGVVDETKNSTRRCQLTHPSIQDKSSTTSFIDGRGWCRYSC